jgi:hypothetical protein
LPGLDQLLAGLLRLLGAEALLIRGELGQQAGGTCHQLCLLNKPQGSRGQGGQTTSIGADHLQPLQLLQNAPVSDKAIMQSYRHWTKQWTDARLVYGLLVFSQLPKRSGQNRVFLLLSLASWSVFLLPFGLLALGAHSPRAVVGQQRALAARQIGAGMIASDPLIR